MTTKDEALKLALEALKSEWDGCVNSPKGEAITAIREALAEQPAQQRHISYVCPQCHWSLDKQPASKPWVWLTDEEVIIMSRYDLEYAALIGEVQRKLKEKNT